MLTESGLQGYFIKKCRQRGLLAYKLVCVGRRGFPDVLVVDPAGGSHYIELKSPTGDGRLSVQQIKIHRELLEQNANVYIIDSKEKASAFVSARQ